METSLKFLGGGAHANFFFLFNHSPEIKGWAKNGIKPPRKASQEIKAFMGKDFPVETVEWCILESIEAHGCNREQYFRAIGRSGRVLLEAIRRNFKNHPEMWRNLK